MFNCLAVRRDVLRVVALFQFFIFYRNYTNKVPVLISYL